MCCCMRRGRHGLKQHRQNLLLPFTQLERELKDKTSLQPNEAEAFHGVHQLFARATGLKEQIWDFDSSEALARHLGVSEAIIALACGSAESHQNTAPQHSRSRSRSPARVEPEFPDFPENGPSGPVAH